MNGDAFNGYPPVIGEAPTERAEAVLRAVGEIEAADALAASAKGPAGVTFAGGVRRLFPQRAWAHTSHAFGHIPLLGDRESPVEITHVGNVRPDTALAGASVTVSLDRLHVADYPGRGMHHVLFDFQILSGRASQEPDSYHFSITQRVREGQRAALIGQPLFVNLPVPAEGLALRCYTLNVKNEEDEKLIAFLDSPVFRAGLRIGSVLHPAVGMLGQMTAGLTRALASPSRRNVPVQDIRLGLGFSRVPVRAALAAGAYVAVQIPESRVLIWQWDEWRFYPSTGHIARADDQTSLLPYNHIVLGVNRHDDSSGGD
ncbi:hypothetical protein ACIHFB_06740 [Streptomyces sp. NPDC051963]|uniref:hypothetical protein n=1 Tax=Streptomyces sp. NPDC051963 TaxID=3365678 RepID=UPI0037CE3856